jgi:murein DD-endopeptidase MepM/ murein hydrolase activator NlpD
MRADHAPSLAPVHPERVPDSPRRSSWRITAAALAAILAFTLLGAPANAIAGSGAAGTSPGGPMRPGYLPPVRAPVVDPFRLANGPYGPGNRGLEYRTIPGTVVRAANGGRVVFAGPVAGRLVVSVRHPDSRRTTLTGLARIRVRSGDLVARGAVVGVAAATLHFGVIDNGRYVDPATLLAGAARAVLVPLRSPGKR